MLDTMRRAASHVTFKILMFLIALSFVVWGIGDIFHGNNDNTIATINGESAVTTVELAGGVKQYMARIQQKFGSALTADQLKSLHLEAEVLQDLINQKLFDREMREFKLNVGNESIVQATRENAMFKNEQGEFDRKLYERVLQVNNLNEATYITSVRNQLISQFMSDALFNRPLPPVSLTKALYEYANQQRVADIVTIPAEKKQPLPVPLENELQRYYNDHNSAYMVPEMRQLSYFVLTADDTAKQISVSDADLHSEFENNIADYKKPETRTIGSLVFQDQASADKAYAQLQHAANVDQVMGSLAGKNAKYDTLNNVTREDLPAEFKDAAFSLPLHGVTKPIHTSFGWHILTIQSIAPAKDPSFDENKAAILKKLTLEKAENQLSITARAIEDEFSGGSSFDEVAKKFGLKIIKTEPVSQKGLTVDGKKAALPPIPNLLKVAFATDNVSASPLTLTPDNSSYFVVYVNKIDAAHPTPFTDIKPQVMDAWQKEQLRRINKKLAEDLQKQLAGGTSVNDVIHNNSLPPVQQQTLRHAAADNKQPLPDELLSDLFAAKVGQPTHVYTNEAGDYVMAVLRSVIPADTHNLDAMKDVKESLSHEMARDLSEEFIIYLHAKYPVGIKQSVLMQALSTNNQEESQ